jgi:hypothetical protein
MSVEHVRADIVPAFKHLAEDEQDSVRLLVVEASSILASILANEGVTVVLPVVRTFSNDKSWRVRYMVGDGIVDVKKCFFFLFCFGYVAFLLLFIFSSFLQLCFWCRFLF